MAYDKHTWTCDEPITVERLNHIEDSIANAGGGDCGYECEEDVTLLTEETVTTVVDPEYPEDGAYGDLSYQEVINPLIANPIRVTFNGTEYECPFNNEGSYGASYNESTGQVDWSQYPFQIIPGSPSAGTSNTLATENAGTYTIKIEVAETTVTTTPCFDLARGYSCDEEMVGFVNGRVRTVTEGSNPFADAVIPYTFLEEPPQTAKITFDFVEYECSRRELSSDSWEYGASDVTFSEYPFIVEVRATYLQLVTPTAGSYSLMIEGMATVSRPTDCFKAAVQACPTGSVLTSDNEFFERKQISCSNAQATTVQPKARVRLFCDASETIQYPTQTCWGSIEIGTSAEGKVLAIPNEIAGNGVYLDIYNFTDNAVTLAANVLRAQVVTFPPADPKTACAVLGQCESGVR